ncbi:hypothetical protein PGTUg99_004884 [Puccinia graminis f. sp. tritici]|uniref:Uncharacterized protein n=1 Tax=Puccinia graminis f. sp. tritici TaxID=56615 RepID=A0A5B0S3M2_PUCGR|nr:hypothetical protein PGTUg99_004884 [Puccinia graminis f. sp. tritici]
MDDPRKTVKAAESAKKQTDNLVAQYGSKSEQIAMERLQSRLAKNPKADVDAKGRVQKIAELSTYICEKYGANAESMRIKDPDDPEKSIRITSNGLSIWGRALYKEDKGVDFDRPPKTDEFVSEPITVYTRDKEAARVGTLKTPKNKGPAKGGICRSASSMASGNHKHGSPAAITPSAPRFTGVRKTSDGRIRPPRLITSPSGSLDPNDMIRSPSLGTPKSANQLHVLGKRGSDSSSVSKAADQSLTDESAKVEEPGCSTTESDGDLEDIEFHPYVRGDSTDGTDIKLVPGDQVNVGSHPSPARKIARVATTSTNAIMHTIDRLEFNTSRPHQANETELPASHPVPSVVPVHEAGAHQAAQLNLPATHPVPTVPVQEVGPTPPAEQLPDSPAPEPAAQEAVTDGPPLNEAGRTLRMEDFLALCSFDANDMVPWVLIDVTHIRHWDFFRDTTVVELQRMGFPFPIAKQLIKGARGLEATHTQANPPNAERANPASPMN